MNAQRTRWVLRWDPTAPQKPFMILDKRLKILGKPMHGIPCNPMHVLVPDFSWICFRTFPGFVYDFFYDEKSIFYEKKPEILESRVRRPGNLE